MQKLMNQCRRCLLRSTSQPDIFNYTYANQIARLTYSSDVVESSQFEYQYEYHKRSSLNHVKYSTRVLTTSLSDRE